MILILVTITILTSIGWGIQTIRLNKLVNKDEGPVIEGPVIEESTTEKVKTTLITTRIVVENNITGKQFTYDTENYHGIKVDNNNGSLVIHQSIEVPDRRYVYGIRIERINIAILTNYSVIKVEKIEVKNCSNEVFNFKT
jgi:hypothetical protein